MSTIDGRSIAMEANDYPAYNAALLLRGKAPISREEFDKRYAQSQIAKGELPAEHRVRTARERELAAAYFRGVHLSKLASIERGCPTPEKVAHWRRPDALKSAAEQTVRSGIEIRIYRCVCNHWHLTSQPKTQKPRQVA
jgi:hypothetical protein